MRKLHRLAQIYSKSGVESFVRKLRNQAVSGIPVLAYHRVLDVKTSYHFDKDLISSSIAAFDMQMKYISKYYLALSMEEYIYYINHPEKLPRKAILVTFDDGFSDNYQYAFPILRKYSVPATFFVTTDFIDSDETIWYERLAYFFNVTKVDKLEFSDYSIDIYDNDKFSSYQKFIEHLKLLPNHTRIAMLDGLYEKYGDPYTSVQTESILSQSMSWEQLMEMQSCNMDIESHTVTHPVLSTLNKQELKLELSRSKQIIEKKLNKKVKSIAYPVGQGESFSDEVIRETIESGYEIAFNYIDSVCKFSNINEFSISRLHVENDTTFDLFKSKISLPELFCE